MTSKFVGILPSPIPVFVGGARGLWGAKGHGLYCALWCLLLRTKARASRRWGARGLRDGPVRRCGRQALQLGVTDVRFDALYQFRCHLPDAVFLGVLSRFLEYLLFRLTSYDVLTPARRIYFGAF
jgi:hypothetical protein